MRKINIKGEITTHHLVIIIVLIVSFAVILFFLFRLDLGGTTDKQICHNSVILKSTAKGFAGELNCKTNYVCVSGGGECKDISATTTLKVNPNNKNEIMNAIADEMADCWWMFGEGKFNYQILPSRTCAICSIIEFDEEILNKNYQINYREFYEYLNEIEIKKGGVSYFEYLYDTRDVNVFQESGEGGFGGAGATGSFDLEIDIDEHLILGNIEYYIVTGIRKKDTFIPPYYIKSYHISGLGCERFVTKA